MTSSRDSHVQALRPAPWRVLAVAALAALALGSAACRGPRLVGPSEPKSSTSVESWRDAVKRWHAAWGHNPLPSPPKATAEDAPHLVALFHEPWGEAAADLLVRSTPALAAGMPIVVERFRESLGTKVLHYDGLNIGRRSIQSEMYKATLTRRSCLRVFRTRGVEANDVVSDLLSLLRRKATEDEFAGTTTALPRAIVEQVGTRVDPLIEALKEGNDRVKYDILTVMAYMRDSATALGPAVEAEIENTNDFTAEHAARTLTRLRWFTKTAVERLRTRLPSASDPSALRGMKRSLALWEKRPLR